MVRRSKGNETASDVWASLPQMEQAKNAALQRAKIVVRIVQFVIWLVLFLVTAFALWLLAQQVAFLKVLSFGDVFALTLMMTIVRNWLKTNTRIIFFNNGE